MAKTFDLIAISSPTNLNVSISSLSLKLYYIYSLRFQASNQRRLKVNAFNLISIATLFNLTAHYIFGVSFHYIFFSSYQIVCRLDYGQTDREIHLNERKIARKHAYAEWEKLVKYIQMMCVCAQQIKR